jgi:ribosomal protein S18 acetylase RimI-like enzyme
MKMRMERQAFDDRWLVRKISEDDAESLGHLMLEAFRGTIDYEGETLADSIAEVNDTLSGKYGPFLDRCSFVIEKDGAVVSAVVVTFFEKMTLPLLAFAMTHPDFKNQGMSSHLIMESINALLDEGYDEAYLVVTEGNSPAIHIAQKIGFKSFRQHPRS